MERIPQMGPPAPDQHERFHFDTEVLSRVLRDGFESLPNGHLLRLEALLHFSRPCHQCLAALDNLARGPEPENRTWQSRNRDPIVLALRHGVEQIWNRSTATEAVEWLRVPHRYWLGRMAVDPLAFARVVVEESRQYSLDLDQYPDLAKPHSNELLSDISDSRLEELHPERWHDLLALARAYLADDFLVQGSLREARLHFQQAEAELAQGTNDGEVRATVLELRADLAVKEGFEPKALKLIESAAELLDSGPIPERLAENRVRNGMIWIMLREFDRAISLFQQALTDTDSATDLPSRLRAFHYLTVARVQNRQFSQALDLLIQGELLYSDRIPERFHVERFVMLGKSYLESGEHALAEGPLRQAVEALYQRGLWLDAAKVLADLGRLYILEDRPEAAADLGREYSKLLRSKAAEELSSAEVRELRKIAARVGLRIPKPEPEANWLH